MLEKWRISFLCDIQSIFAGTLLGSSARSVPGAASSCPARRKALGQTLQTERGGRALLHPGVLSLFPVARVGTGACRGQPVAWGQGTVKGQSFDFGKTLQSAPEHPLLPNFCLAQHFPVRSSTWVHQHFSDTKIFPWKISDWPVTSMSITNEPLQASGDCLSVYQLEKGVICTFIAWQFFLQTLNIRSRTSVVSKAP